VKVQRKELGKEMTNGFPKEWAQSRDLPLVSGRAKDTPAEKRKKAAVR